MDTNGTEATNGAEVDVKPEVKKEFVPDFQVKEEHDGEEDATNGKRRSRTAKGKVNLTELSDSADSDESGPPKKKARTPASRGRGAKKVADNMSPQVVLEDIDKVDTPSARGRGRGRGRGTPASARGRGRGGAKAAPKKVVEEMEESDEDIEDSGDDAEITDEDSEDDWEGEETGKKKKPVKAPTSKRGGRGGGKAGGKPAAKKGKKKDDDDEDEENGEEDEEAEMPPMSDANVNDLSGPVRTGQFMLEKADTRHLENYPIWRMEGPNMLRKFEMFISDGKVRHKSLYAYSSWAQSMVDLYTRIQVQQLSSSDGEITVEVKKDYIPQAPSLESLQVQYGSDANLPDFQTFTQALFKQALDSKFLSSIKENGDSTYLQPIAKFDEIITSTVKQIESEVNMKEEFMTRVKSCPNMKGIKRQNWSQTDQATVDKVTEKGVRSVLMFGYGYDPFLMTEDSSRGVEVAQEIIIGSTMEKYLRSYHGLTHFKYSLLKRCQDKVKMEKGLKPDKNDDEILAVCMGDQIWILQTFEDLQLLLKY